MDLADHPPHFRHEMDEIIASIRRHVRDNFGRPKTVDYYRKLDRLLEPLVEDLDPSKRPEWQYQSWLCQVIAIWTWQREIGRTLLSGERPISDGHQRGTTSQKLSINSVQPEEPPFGGCVAQRAPQEPRNTLASYFR